MEGAREGFQKRMKDRDEGRVGERERGRTDKGKRQRGETKDKRNEHVNIIH